MSRISGFSFAAIRRLRHDRQHALVAHDGAHAAAARPSALVVARPELVLGAERHRRHVAILVVLAGGADGREVRVGVAILQPHDLLVAGQPEQIASGLERNLGAVLAVPDHQVNGRVRPALQNHLVEPGPFELGAELQLPADYRGGQPLVGDLERAVGREIRPQPGRDVRRRQHAGVDDQRILGCERVRDGPLRQDLERSPESSQHILEVPARHVFDADVPRCQVDGRAGVQDSAWVATGSVGRSAHEDNPAPGHRIPHGHDSTGTPAAREVHCRNALGNSGLRTGSDDRSDRSMVGASA